MKAKIKKKLLKEYLKKHPIINKRDVELQKRYDKINNDAN